MDSDPQVKHNGANTNLYCDGELYFVVGCPACGRAYEARMEPRQRRASALAAELAALGITGAEPHADLWTVSAKGMLNGRFVTVRAE